MFHIFLLCAVFQVSALELVFENETEDVSPWIISKHLQFFSGLLAVGTEGGYVYLVGKTENYEKQKHFINLN